MITTDFIVFYRRPRRDRATEDGGRKTDDGLLSSVLCLLSSHFTLRARRPLRLSEQI